MKNNPFERSSFLVLALTTIVMVVAVAFIFIIVKSTIGGTSIICLPIYAGIFLFFAYICYLPIVQLMTKYTDSGIEQSSFFGSRSLRWQDVKEIRNITTGGIILISSDTKINVNLFLFKSPQDLLFEIRSRIPESVYPSDTEINNEIYRRKQNDVRRSIIGALIALVLIIAVGKNMYALIFGLLMLAFMIYEIRNWLKYRSLQS